MNYRKRSANWERVLRVVWAIFGVAFFSVGVDALVSDSTVVGVVLIFAGVAALAMAAFAKAKWLEGLG
jgi:uncharacterized membrane protein HdeD (DUF308 family)